MTSNQISSLQTNKQLDRLAYWFPLVNVTRPTGIYKLGNPKVTDQVLLLGNNRRIVSNWQTASLDVYIVIVNTNGETLSKAIANNTITIDSLVSPITQLKLKHIEPSVCFLPLHSIDSSVVDRLADLTSTPCRQVPSHPANAIESICTGDTTSTTIPRNYPLLFNLALFMSCFTLTFSLIFDSAYSWFWFLLPWLACLGEIIFTQLSFRIIRGALWGMILSMAVTIWQVNIQELNIAIGWGLATLLISVWSSWRVSQLG